MQFMTIARKDLRVLFRDRSAMIFIFGLPIIMTSIFGVIFGSKGKEENRAPLKILVSNLDTGRRGVELIDSMQKMGMAAELAPLGATAVEQQVKNGDRPFGLTIPADFSSGLGAAVKGMAANDPKAPQVVLHVWIDPAQTQMAGIAENTIRAATQRVYGPLYRAEALARIPEAYRQFAEQNMPKGTQKPPVELNVSSSATTTETSTVKPSPGDTLIPGFAVYFVFFMANGVASTLLAERQEGTLRRMLTTPVSRSQVLVGKLMARGLMGMIQTALLFLVGHFWLNLHLNNSPVGLILTALATIFCATGLGLLIATMGKTMEQIQGMTTMVLLMLGFLSGTLVPRQFLPESMQKISRITPHAWALDAYQDLILRHKSLLATLPNIGVVMLFGVVFFGLALARFRFE